jgi:multicomponent Na+:H+ antiporter subunit D
VDHLLALVVAVPLLTAAAIFATRPLLGDRRRVLDAVAIGAAASVAVMLMVIMARTAGGDQVYWFGGFRPARGIAMAAVLVTASMAFSWRYFRRVATYYHALMLIFLAGMTGFCLTGDIFDLFVWFELMGVAAYALTAYRPEERGSLQGALNFAITNSVGAYLSLSGIALIYDRTGALNMVQIAAFLDLYWPPAAAATRLRTGCRADRAHPALPERRDQRLRDLDRARPGGHWRRARVDHPLARVRLTSPR